MGVFDGIVMQAYKDLLGPSGEKTRLGQIFDDGYHGLGPINDPPAAALDVKNVALGSVVPNVCAIGSTGHGHALLTLDNRVIHGLDAVAAAPDKKVAPDPNTRATGDAEGWVFPMHFHNRSMIIPNPQTKGDYCVVQGCSDGSTSGPRSSASEAAPVSPL